MGAATLGGRAVDAPHAGDLVAASRLAAAGALAAAAVALVIEAVAMRALLEAALALAVEGIALVTRHGATGLAHELAAALATLAAFLASGDVLGALGSPAALVQQARLAAHDVLDLLDAQLAGLLVDVDVDAQRGVALVVLADEHAGRHALAVKLDDAAQAAGLAGLLGGLDVQVHGSLAGLVVGVDGNDLHAREVVVLGGDGHGHAENLAELDAGKLCGLGKQAVDELDAVGDDGKLVGLLKLAGIALLGGEGIDGLGAALLALGDDGDETGDAFGESLTVLDLHTHRALATGKLNLGVAVLAVIAKKPHVSSRLAMKDSKKLKDTLAISVTRHAHKSVLKALST